MRARDDCNQLKRQRPSSYRFRERCYEYEPDQKSKLEECNNEEVISKNVTKLLVELDISSLEYVGRQCNFENGTLTSEQDVYRTNLLVNRRNGRIIVFGEQNEITPQMLEGELSVQLELLVYINNSEYCDPGSGEQQYSFEVIGPQPEDVSRGCLPLEYCLGSQGVANMASTLDYCNDDLQVVQPLSH